MPVTSFAEPDPTNRTGGDKRIPNAWFALDQLGADHRAHQPGFKTH
ncbi:protein of unknown function [Nitratireductor aquimarinus]